MQYLITPGKPAMFLNFSYIVILWLIVGLCINIDTNLKIHFIQIVMQFKMVAVAISNMSPICAINTIFDLPNNIMLFVEFLVMVLV